MIKKLCTRIAIFLVIASPLTFYIWFDIDKLLLGNFSGKLVTQILVSTIIFLLVARSFGSQVQKYVGSVP